MRASDLDDMELSRLFGKHDILPRDGQHWVFLQSPVGSNALAKGSAWLHDVTYWVAESFEFTFIMTAYYPEFQG